MDIVRVLRIVEIVGPRDLVERQVNGSLHGQRLGAKSADGQVVIRAATIGTYPEILAISVGEQKSA
jgi:hypothetical protein